MTTMTDIRLGEFFAEKDFSRALAGGKAHNLARLEGCGVRVPKWTAVTAEGFERLPGGAKYAPDMRQRRQFAADARQKLGMCRLVAVRSSAADEDSAQHSFAGQLDSFLFQPVDDNLLETVLRCHRSAFGERAAAYRRARELRGKTRAAVIIQEMVAADVSGVAFTANPLTGDPETMLVSAVYGMGEGLVSGALDADLWTLDGEGNILSETICDKREKLVFNEEFGRGLVKINVDENLRLRPALGKKQLAELARACREIEKTAGGFVPQDIEFCFRGDELFILQTRTIAAFSGLRKEPRHALFDNSNVVESYAGVVKPLTFSFISESFRATYSGVLERLGFSRGFLEANAALLENMLGTSGGRVYYNLLNWYAYLSLIPGPESTIADHNRMIGAQDCGGGFALRRATRTEEMRAGLLLRWKILTARRGAEKFAANFHKQNARWLKSDFAGMGNGELLAAYREVFSNCSARWDAEIINAIGVLRCSGELRRLLAALGPECLALYSDLLGGGGSIASLRPALEMAAIAGKIRGNPQWRELFASKSPLELRVEILETGKWPELRKRFSAFLEEYGCRCMNELKLEEDTLRENPDFLFETVKAYAAKPPDILGKSLDAQAKTRAKAEAAVFARAGFFGGLRLRLALRRTRYHVYAREELRFLRGKYFGIVRRLVNSAGRNLHADGVIDNPADIFFLKIAEIFELAEGRSPDLRHVKRLIALRKEEHEEHLKQQPPGRFYAYGDVCALRFAPLRAAATGGADGVLRGTPCGPGSAKGTARVALSGADARGLNGEILVAERTDPGWIPLFPSISALVVEKGSVLSHSAVVAREMGIPAVVGVAEAAKKISSGQTVEVDGNAGTVKICG
ncbi:MAG: PEP/pyruvate-binding domain-containing protein [Elusimicrobiales bacterium]